MNTRRSIVGLCLAPLVCAVPALAEMPTAENPLRVTYATYLQTNTAFTRVDAWFMEEVTRRSGGGIVFETYYGGSLLGAVDIYPGVSSGAVDIVMGAPGYNVDMLPYSSVVQPFITDKVDAAMQAVQELYDTEPVLRAEWNDNNLELLYPLAAGENSIWLTRKVERVEDLAGLRIRSTLGIAEALNALGATTVALPSPDAIEGMRRGAIEGIASLPFDTAMDLGLYQIASYATDAGRMGVYGLMAAAANKAWWDGLDPEVRDLLSEVAAEAPAKYIEIMADQLEGLVTRLADRDSIEVITLSDEENARWAELASKAVWDKWLSDMSSRGLDGAAILERYRELIVKHEPDSTYKTGLDVWRARYGGAE